MIAARVLGARELMALIVSAVVVATSLCYWAGQILGVIANLRLAYG